MGYLGLSEPIEKQDNLFQRLFWPSDDAAAMDSLGRQGFWICLILAGFSLVAYTAQGHPILALLALAFFTLGGIGVREHSVTAASLVAAVYLLDLLAKMLLGLFFPSFGDSVTVVAAMLLLANIRGTWLAAHWIKHGEREAFPERMSDTWRDRLVDQMPPKVWPTARFVFYIVAAIYMTLSVLGIFLLAISRHPK